MVHPWSLPLCYFLRRSRNLTPHCFSTHVFNLININGYQRPLEQGGLNKMLECNPAMDSHPIQGCKAVILLDVGRLWLRCNVLSSLYLLGTLKEHRMRHTGERPHKCEYCDATFINSTSLKTHTTKHTGILPHKCEVCGKLFAKSYGLKIHSFSHSKEKPFVCEVSVLLFLF